MDDGVKILALETEQLSLAFDYSRVNVLGSFIKPNLAENLPRPEHVQVEILHLQADLAAQDHIHALAHFALLDHQVARVE